MAALELWNSFPRQARLASHWQKKTFQTGFQAAKEMTLNGGYCIFVRVQLPQEVFLIKILLF